MVKSHKVTDPMASIANTLHRAFVTCAVLTTTAGLVYVPLKLWDIRSKGKELEEYAFKRGISLQEAAVHLGYQKPEPKET